MRLTKKQRAEVVELLRCAFDTSKSIARVGEELDSDVARIAIFARSNVFASNHDAGIRLPDYFDECLEAAQRVEEGSWP